MAALCLDLDVGIIGVGWMDKALLVAHNSLDSPLVDSLEDIRLDSLDKAPLLALFCFHSNPDSRYFYDFLQSQKSEAARCLLVDLAYSKALAIRHSSSLVHKIQPIFALRT